MTDVERIATLEVIIQNQQKMLDDHEERIDGMESIIVLVNKLSDSVDKQTINIEMIAGITNKINETLKCMEFRQNKIEERQKNILWDSLRAFIKEVGFFKILIGFSIILGLTKIETILNFFFG